MKRRTTRQIHVGTVPVGGDAPVSVQTMTKTDTRDVDATVEQINEVATLGCDIVRLAVVDVAAASALGEIRRQSPIPLIADIHFDHRLALAALAEGVEGLRITPGNIGGDDNVRAVVEASRERMVPIRIGVNAGSLEKGLLQQFGGATAEALVESAMRHVRLLEACDYHEIKLSVKASDVARTLAAYRLLSERTDSPLHLGVTEAGTFVAGTVRSSVALGILLEEGIGDTIRVSLTRDPVDEVRVGYEILKALKIRQRGPEIVSCPTCGRCDIDLFELVERIESTLLTRTTPVQLAIMGCVVNGPGEAREADIGIAGGKGYGVLFKKGKVVRKVKKQKWAEALLQEVEAYESRHRQEKK